MPDEQRDRAPQTGDETLSGKLTLPLVLEEGRAPKLFVSLSIVGCLFVIGAVIWGSVTQIRELAIAPGQIRPAGSARLIQHLKGGMVIELLAKEGELVARGAPLVRLQPTAANSEFEQLRLRTAALSLKQRRLSAAISGKDPVFGDLAVKYPDLAARQRALLTKSRSQAQKQRIVLQTRIDRRKADIDTLTRRVADLASQLKVLKEQVKTRSGLLKKGLVPKVAFLEMQRIHEKTISEHLAGRRQQKNALKSLNEARGALLQFDADRLSKLTAERAKTTGQLAKLKASLAKPRNRAAHHLVRAPIRGIVQELGPKAIGRIVKPGDPAAKIIPLGRQLIAEVQIAPRDIGHVNIGDRADIRMSSLDAARYGPVKGTVRKLSATTFQNARGDRYYRGIISLDRNFVGTRNRRNMIRPGMAVSAEIVIGAKSLTRYLLKPVYSSLNVAFSEH
jgi:HlyD family secretion protein/adhesin transport system membrane fusion protein